MKPDLCRLGQRIAVWGFRPGLWLGLCLCLFCCILRSLRCLCLFRFIRHCICRIRLSACGFRLCRHSRQRTHIC